MKKGFYIKEVKAMGKDTRVSSVNFTKELNIIAGVSNTGKSCIANCIDFAFGADNSPFKEKSKYNEVSVVISTYDDNEIIINREVGKNKVKIESKIESIKSGTYSVAKKTPKTMKSLSWVIMNLLGYKSDTEPRGYKNSNYITSRITWRTFLRIVYLAEDKICNSKSIITPKGDIGNTLFLSALLFIITGEELDKFDEIESQEIKKAKKAALDKYIIYKINSLTDEYKKLEKELSTKKEDDIENIISNMVDDLKKTEKEIIEAKNNNRKLVYEIQSIDNRIIEINVLSTRFENLKSQYSSDITRLSFIVNGEKIYNKNENDENVCPFCNSRVPHKHNTSYIEPANEELNRITLQLSGLEVATKDAYAEKLILERNLKEKQKEFDDNNKLIDKKLVPQFNELKSKIKNYKGYLQMTKNKEFIERFKKDFEVDLANYKDSGGKNGAEKYDPKKHYPAKFYDMMDKYAYDILNECNYSNLSKARYDSSICDIEVNGEAKGTSNGKGYRAFLNTIVILMLRKYLSKEAKLYHGFFIIDTPLHGFDEGVDETTPESMRKGLYEYFVNNQQEGQLIVIENNEHLPNIDYKSKNINMIEFTKNDNKGRYGFLEDER